MQIKPAIRLTEVKPCQSRDIDIPIMWHFK